MRRLALAVAGVARGRGPAVLAPGERRPLLRAVHRRAAVDLHHGRRVSQQQQHSVAPLMIPRFLPLASS